MELFGKNSVYYRNREEKTGARDVKRSFGNGSISKNTHDLVREKTLIKLTFCSSRYRTIITERGMKMDTGKLIREQRIAKGLSHQKLADKAGVTKRALIYWESGERKITLECLDKVLKALDIEIKIGA